MYVDSFNVRSSIVYSAVGPESLRAARASNKHELTAVKTLITSMSYQVPLKNRQRYFKRFEQTSRRF